MIVLTDKAVSRVKKQLAQRGFGIGVKVGVVRSGVFRVFLSIGFC
ncbi:hypothetical protein [Rappaport israeli]|nr:hypothetical protein [Rappaport israeli]